MRPHFLSTAASIIGTVLVLLASTACKSPDRRAARAELTSYLQRAADWAPVEAETARAIDRILATQFVDEAEVRRQIDADAPRVQAHIARIASITPRTPELREIHLRYLDAWRELAAGYDRLLHGIDTGDAADLAAGRRDLEGWRQGILDTAKAIRRLRDSLAG